MVLKLNRFSYQDIEVGQVFSFKRLVDEPLNNQFAELTGNLNPLHFDSEYADKTVFKGRIAYGMLLASFFSALLGMLCPGEKSLCLSQTIYFKKPLFLGRNIIVEGTVLSKSDATQTVEMATRIKDEDGATVVDGVAVVKML